MCGRATLTVTVTELEKRFNVLFYSEDLERYNPLPNYNIAPTQVMPIISNKDLNHFNLYRWGLVPNWAKDLKIGSTMINARIETIKEKSTYTESFQNKRCLVPIDSFYEWQKIGSQRIPYRISTKDQKICSLAGLWDIWINEKGEEIGSYTIITIPANEFMKPLHDRMPAILDEPSTKLWLSDELSPEDHLELLKPYESSKMQSYTVGPRVNKVSENDEKLIEKYAYPIQQSLF
jgi:putative SOS response-associated peptidase YedK